LNSDLLQIVLKTAASCDIPIVIIGGLALPAYNVARSTLDLDICIYIKNQEELNKFINILNKSEISTIQTPKINHNLFTVFGKGGEAEIWLQPCDTFHWDEKMVSSIKNFYSNVYVLAVEDFILTKLARSDRSSTDINDILQILIANTNIIDWEYLIYRLKWVGLEKEFNEVLKGFKSDFANNLRNISKNIWEKFKNKD
jgi:hypothetical protein